MTWLSRRAPAPRRLRTHLLGLALALLLPALALGGAVAWRAVSAYRDAFEARLHDTARALALAVDREIGAFTATLEGLAASPLLGEGAGPAELEAFRARALPVADALGTWVVVAGPGPDHPMQMHMMVPAGVPLGSGLRLPGPEAPLPRVFETGRPAIGGVAIGLRSGRPTAFLFVPVRRDGRVVRAVGMALDPGRLSTLLAAQGFQDGGYAKVVDARGNVAARSHDHDAFVGRPASGWYTAATADRPGGFLRGPEDRQPRVVLGFAPVAAAAGWSVAVVEPWSAYAGSWRRPLQALALGGAALLALGLLLAARLARSLLRPVHALAADAAAVAAAGRGDAPPAPSAPPSSVLEFEALRRDIAAAERALRTRAEEAGASEERLRLAVEGTGMATWDLDLGSGRLVWSRHHFLMLGLDPDRAEPAAMGDWRARVLPEDLPAVEAAFAAARSGRELFHALYRIRRADDGAQRWMESLGRFVEGSGDAPRFVGVMFDITDRRAAEERQRLLMREVDHRAKNVLAVVQSVLRLTRADDPRAFAAAVEGRVLALARAHDLLARDRWHGAGLREVVAQELAPYRGGPDGAARVAFEGPRIRLAPDAVQPFGMVLHELATNAAKHGALSVPQGTLRVTWWRGPDGGLLLRWEERGGPRLPGEPERRGFGSRLIGTTLRGQLGGGADFAWEPDGLVCLVTVAAARLDPPRNSPAMQVA